jgi:hypothetical protein
MVITWNQIASQELKKIYEHILNDSLSKRRKSAADNY